MATLSEMLSPEQIQTLLAAREKAPYSQGPTPNADALSKFMEQLKQTPTQAPAAETNLPTMEEIGATNNNKSIADSLKRFSQKMAQTKTEVPPAAAAEEAGPTLESLGATSETIPGTTPDAATLRQLMSKLGANRFSFAPAAEAAAPALEAAGGVGAGTAALGAAAGAGLLGAAALASPPMPNDQEEMAQKAAALAPVPAETGPAGPQATIGNNPGNPSPPSDDGEEEEPPSASVAAKAPDSDKSVAEEADEDEEEAPKSVSSPATPPAPGATDYLSALMKSLGGNGEQELKDAQERQGQLQSNNNISRAWQSLSSAMSRGHWKPDEAAYESMMKQAAQPVENLKQKQALATEKLGNALKLSDFNDKQQMQDAASPISQAYRDMAKIYSPQLSAAPNFKSMSAEMIKAAQPMIDTKIKAEQMGLLFKERLDVQNERTNNRNELTVGSAVENATSRRGAAGLAEQTNQMVDRLKSFITTHPDLTVQEMKILFGDIDAAIRGGSGTLGGSAKLEVSTLQSKLAGVIQDLTNKPQDAKLGAFKQRYLDIANDVQASAQRAVKRHVSNIIENSKNAVRPEFYDNLKERYIKNTDWMNGGSSAPTQSSQSSGLPPGLSKEEFMKHYNAKQGQ